ncbi:DMT family transporter [Methylobacterium terricola]|uniref:DMT family transporter n=1 Tax=Methylobacterium terricola TaxID=2583531 RepID=A0A5C4LR88_9HYPH|nr:DMT family transporter [Methylobacterium terricola]TNC16326.1 DMT family transporter [Methylobacterium terricola]
MKPLPDLVAVVLWMAGALLSFSATAIAVREVAPALGLFDILAVRAAAGVAVVGVVALVRRRPLPARRLRLHLARNLVHWGGNYAWSLGVTLLPLAVVFALEFTTPAWVTLLAVLILRERLTASRVAAVVLGFLGVLVVLRPGLAALQPASLVVLLSAILFALTAVATKALTRTESVLSILFWMNLIQLPLNLAAGRIFPAAPVHAFEGRHGLALAVLCIAGLTSHWCLTSAYRRGDAILVMPLDFLRIPLIALLGWRLYGEPLDPWLFLGAALIVGGIVWNLAAEARRQAPAVIPKGA